jgi:threonine dehydrogenase-like Zn-dependent dehydrogenase
VFAAQVHDKDGSLVLGEVIKPVAGPNDVIVRVEAAGLAPGIFHQLRKGAIPILPTILGHEIAGVVESAGELVAPEIIGTRVRVHPNLSCGICEYCTTDREMMCSAESMIGHGVFGPRAIPRYTEYHNGGLAEFVKVPASNLDELPSNVSFELGAKVHDFANALHALRLAIHEPGSTVIVTAATGAMGTATMALAREFGVARIIAVGRDSERLAKVVSIDPDRIRVVHISDDDTADGVVDRIRAIEPSGAHAAIDFLPAGPGASLIFGGIRYGGRIVHMGMNPAPFPVPPARIAYACISFIGTRNCTRRDALDVLSMIARDPDRFSALITHRFPLEDANTARAMLESRTEPIWMSVISPSH